LAISRCHLLNDLGHFVTPPAGSLFDTYNYILKELLDVGIIVKDESIDTAAICSTNAASFNCLLKNNVVQRYEQPCDVRLSVSTFGELFVSPSLRFLLHTKF